MELKQAEMTWGRKVARVWYYSRVLAVTSSAYAIGYQQAIISYATDPLRKENEIIAGLVQQGGGTAVLSAHSPEARLVEHVGRKVLEASRLHCQLKLNELRAIKKGQPHLVVPERLALPRDGPQPPPKVLCDLCDEELTANASHLAEELTFWETALQRMSKPWCFIVCKSPSANAFVSDMAPNRVFVFSGLLEMKLTPHELALCLAHEVSHTILGHSKAKSDLDYILAHLHMLLLISIPELVFAQEFATALMSSIVQSSFSRGCETEADARGAQITARACYDPLQGANLFKKLSQFEKGLGSSSAALSWFRSHPLSQERHDKLLENAETVNKGRMRACRWVAEDLHACRLAKHFG